MKKKSFLLLFAVLCVLIAQCTKDKPIPDNTPEPVAAFTTDSEYYFAGETVHLINNSQDAEKYVWTMPDGSTTTEKEPVYLIDSTIVYQNLTFKLEAFSKNGKKSDTNSIIVLAILKPKMEKNSFTNGSFTYYVSGSLEDYNSGDNWVMHCYANQFSVINIGVLFVYFSGSVETVQPGQYEVKSNTQLKANQCYIFLKRDCSDCLDPNPYEHTYQSLYGTLVLAKKNNKNIIVFNDIESTVDSSNVKVAISGFREYNKY